MQVPQSRTPFVVLAVSLLLTLAATGFVMVTGAARDQARFENAMQSTQDRINGRLDTYVAMLAGARGLFAASDTVTRRDFATYIAELEIRRRYPGVQGLGFARRVAPGERGAVAAAWRGEGMPGFHVWPAGERAEYHPIVYLEPLDRRNRAALGFDMFTEPVRRAAMERARDSGLPAMSGKVTLKQEIDQRPQAGFLMYVPIYRGGRTPATVDARRAALQGFVYSPFRAGDLFAGIFGTERNPRVAFRVYDGPRAATEQLLYDARPNSAAPRARPAFAATTTVAAAGHVWTLAFTSLPYFEAWSGRLIATLIAALGLVLSFTLFAVTRAEVRARGAVQASGAARNRFFAAMSHELRTPLNAIIGYNDLLLANVYGPLAADQQRGIERSQKAARHLLELVNDVLDLSKIEAGKIEVELEEVQIPALVDELFTTIRPMADAHGSELRLDGDGCARRIRTDPRRVRQILLNLLSNATRFGGGHPVSVRCANTRAGGVEIAVVDRGPGIAAADHVRIFEEFVQLPNAAAGGTGLGLPISRRLAELLGGRLEVESAPGSGSTFRLVLPGEAPGGI
jgi:signal transduction histidine kinase